MKARPILQNDSLDSINTCRKDKIIPYTSDIPYSVT